MSDVSTPIASPGGSGWVINPAFVPPGAQNPGATVVNDLVTGGTAAALSAEQGKSLNTALLVGNKYGFNTPALPTETPLAAATTAAAPITDWFNTISSDGDGTGNTHQDWGGLQRGILTRMSDGTLFCAYIQNNAGTDRLRIMRSPTGGPTGSGSTWTQVTTITTTCYKSISLRDKTRDQLIVVTCEGTSPNLIIKLRVFDTTGAQVGSTYSVNTAGKGFAQTLTDQGFYYEAGISHQQDSSNKTRVVLGGWTLPLPLALQQNTTQSCLKQVQWLFWDGANWTQEPVRRYSTGVRMDYDQMIVGAGGDPDVVYGIYQGNVAMWESVGQFQPERLAPNRLPGFYAFDRFGVWWHNRRTNEFMTVETSPTLDWAIRPWDGTGASYNASNDIPEARTRQATFNAATGDWWIVYKCIRPNKYTPPAALTCTGSISVNTLTVSSVPTSTTIGVGTKIVNHSLATTGWRTVTITALGTGTGSTGTYTIDEPNTVGSGTLSMVNAANASATQAATLSWRIQIVTPKGQVKYDGELLNFGYGLMGLTQVASGRIYWSFMALGGDSAQTQYHFGELTLTADGEVNAISTVLANSYNSDNNPVAGSVGFGTNSTYLGGAATFPARCSNQGPIFADYQHGSKPTTNTIDLLISRRATDHNSVITPTTTGDSSGHKMDLARMRVPA
jgi:hypothetical protein